MYIRIYICTHAIYLVRNTHTKQIYLWNSKSIKHLLVFLPFVLLNLLLNHCHFHKTKNMKNNSSNYSLVLPRSCDWMTNKHRWKQAIFSINVYQPQRKFRKLLIRSVNHKIKLEWGEQREASVFKCEKNKHVRCFYWG